MLDIPWESLEMCRVFVHISILNHVGKSSLTQSACFSSPEKLKSFSYSPIVSVSTKIFDTITIKRQQNNSWKKSMFGLKINN
jgi:hypothetical protein